MNELPSATTRGLALRAAVVIAYVAAAALGFRLAFVAEQITTVWAPTGIALAALLTGGLRLWPAVWVGALLANLGTDAPAWTAVSIATGNTLEAVAAVWWLRRLPHVEFTFERIADVLAFVPIAIVCTAISATIGVTTLCVAAVQPWDRFTVLWFDWWLGDALGALVVAPALLTAVSHTWSKATSLRALAWITAAVGITFIVFGQLVGLSPHPVEYVVFPLVISAAVIGGPAITSFVVLGASIVAIWQTVSGRGPFAGAQLHDSLVLLQTFMGVLAGTSLLLAAAVAERLRAEHRERQAAVTLRHRQELLRMAQRAGGVATFEWDFRRHTAHCSAEFFDLLGLPADDGVLTSEEWSEFVHRDDRERMAAHLSRAIEGLEPAAADYRIAGADGRIRWVTYSGQIQQTADGDRMLGTVVDITDRKRMEADLRHHVDEVERILIARVEAEAALRENRDVLTLAMRGGSMGAWSRNVVTNQMWWSRELEELFGLEPGVFSRTEDGFFEFVHEDDRDAVRAAVDHAVQSRSDYVIEFRFRHASGEWRWMEGRGRALYEDDGTPRTLYGIGIDITDRKHGEIALRDAKSAAESANQLKDQFLATLSHELRTPLNAILGYARMLQTHSIAPEKRPRAIDVIVRNAIAQNQLVEDLLDMSRITTGKVRLDPVPVPVVTVLREAVEGVKPAADAKGITLEIDFDPFAGSVRADTTRLQQVFWNLLTNAVKFTSDGGRITLVLHRNGANVEIVVRDTGVGISAEFLPFVFDPFRQGESRLDRAHGGLGLGLAITKQLVELHGGTIHATSLGLGRGATFTVTLPCVETRQIPFDANAPQTPAAFDSQESIALDLSLEHSGPAPSLNGLKILLVDDEEDTLTLFRDGFEHAGADVQTASDSRVALDLAEAWQPDLLVTDLGLPGMDGYALLQAVRANPSIRACPAVAVSAYARLDDRSRALAAGFQAHVAKPVDPTTLVRVLVAAVAARG